MGEIMSRILRAGRFGFAAIAFCLSASAAAQAATKGQLDGVWTITKIVTTGANPASTTAQPSLVIFDSGYYAYVSGGSEPRQAAPLPKNPDALTGAEKLAKYAEWEAVTGQAGTFDIKGTTLTRHPTVAKNVSVMTTDGPITQEFKLSGDSLLLTSKSLAGRPASETVTTLTRVR
jgi:hypothetical protein